MAMPSMRIGELAKQAGLATSALQFYEEIGLLGPATRTEAGYRVDGPKALGRLEFVQRAKSVGLSLTEIRDLITSPGEDQEVERDRLRHLVVHKFADTHARIQELTALRSELERLHVRLLRAPGLDCGHVGDCTCWLPTDEEVKLMESEVKNTETCSCCCCDCPGEQCSCCGCSCP